MGAINVKHTGAGADIALSSDGTSLLLDGTAIGGGGAALELYAENPSNPTAPSATGTNAVAIGNGSKAHSTDAIGLGNGSWARGTTTFAVFGDAQPSSTAGVAIGLGTVSSAAAALALGRDSYALAASAISLGKGRASGAASFAAAITNNSASYGASGANSVAIGQYSRATAGGGISIGSAFSRADGSQSVAIGRNVHATDSNSMALGNEAVSDVRGKLAYSGGKISATGDSQYGLCVLRQQTTDATASVMKTTAYNANPSADNQVILPNNSAYAFSGTIVARQQASQGTASAAWKVEGLIRREGSAGTTVLVNSATTVLDNTPAWGMALTADTTHGGLAITVTGAASTNVRFVATINTSEVTY